MCTATTSPRVSQLSTSAPAAVVRRRIWVTRHSKLTGLSSTRSTFTRRPGTGVRPARVNSSTSGPTEAQLAFMASARARVARFQTNSPVAWALATVSFQPMVEKPTMGGT